MKWSTIGAVFSIGTALVVLTVVVQLWSVESEPQPETVRAKGDSMPDAEPETVVALDEERGVSEARASDEPRTTTSREDATVAEDPSSPDERSARSDDQSRPVVTEVKGDIGNLTFSRQVRDGTTPPAVDTTRISVVGEKGQTYEFTSSSGQPVIVSRTFDEGLYKWEAVHKPQIAPRVRQELMAARKAGDFEAERALKRKYRQQGLLPSDSETAANRQSGSFRVVNGQVVDDSVRESRTN